MNLRGPHWWRFRGTAITVRVAVVEALLSSKGHQIGRVGARWRIIARGGILLGSATSDGRHGRVEKICYRLLCLARYLSVKQTFPRRGLVSR